MEIGAGGGGTERGRYVLWAKEGESHLYLKFPETQKWRVELLSNKRPHINDEIALRKVLAGNN